MPRYSLYLVESLGAPRNHHAIFVEYEEGGTGALFQVKGNIQDGMTYETKQTGAPDASNSFLSKSKLGWINTQDLGRVDSICRSNPPPERQFDGPRRINKNIPLRRCQEWTSETIGKLRAEGVLMDR
ncbi:hypothetical protein GGR51DRAFT_511953 [Nemania sp. FL0031]|nr:hypothetical protein GGR51DRAFT_511953 [Nemania sp. FL0031]